MSDHRLQEISARVDAYNADGLTAEVGNHFAAADLAWLLAEVERLRQLTAHDEHWRRQFYALRNRVRKAGVSI